ncbi:MAG: Asp-tRNA(Asn)/Glu-tRNA(Gln) amidotransferase GatCAB subunit A, partial [Chloroflexi bacterium]|nr:Asp-tRNA(Asn)/Glu-tRNA(Gln) amidotransferase GatCAB subunit A [Chloroflexota bacterium]
MADAALTTMTVAALGQLIRDARVSPVEVAEAFLDRIEVLQPRLNAFITVMREQALAAARQAEAEIASGRYRGPLHGIPVGLKDLFWTRGVRTTSGSAVTAGFVPDEDATVVSRLAEAGASFAGKTNMVEYAYGG